MYAIKNDDMYLMDYRIGALPVPTCVWSIRPEDARLFESRGEAKAVADRTAPRLDSQNRAVGGRPQRADLETHRVSNLVGGVGVKVSERRT